MWYLNNFIKFRISRNEQISILKNIKSAIILDFDMDV